MTYDPGAGAPEGAEPTEELSSAPEPERVRTGVERVDEVIRAVEELEERPIEEHVGVFETAHTQLRRALDHQGEDDPVDPDASQTDPHGGE
jgi:hypothetical protein